MRHVLTLALFLIALSLTAGLTEPWPETDRQLWPAGAFVGDFCDSPGAAGAGLCQDFEENQSNCALAKAYGTINALGEIGYVGGSPDCANAVAPLDGTYDFAATNDGTSDFTGWYPVDGTGSATICATNEDCVLTFYMNIANDSGAAVTEAVGGIYSDAGTSLCEAAYRPSVNQIRAKCTVGSLLATVITPGTTYKVCAWYKQDDDCYVAIDPASGTWCAGATGNVTQNDCNGGAHVEAGWISYGDVADHVGIQLDDMMIIAVP